MRILFCLFCLAFAGCSDISSPATATKSDTVFIKRVPADSLTAATGELYYNSIYIDPNPGSKYYRRLADFSFDTLAAGGINIFTETLAARKIIRQKINILDLPKEWVPLFLYKGAYYLYIPSDWGNTMRLMLTDSTFIMRGMEDPWISPLVSLKKINNTLYTIGYLQLFPEKNPPPERRINIYIIDPVKQVAVWEFPDETDEEYRRMLYVSKEHVKDFPVIVNQSAGKATEYDFEKIDFKKLLQVKKDL
jgi:hypothetical protein